MAATRQRRRKSESESYWQMLDHIPDEVWETLICPHLPTASLVSLSMVSCRFRDISRSVTPCDSVIPASVTVYDASMIAMLADAVEQAEEIKCHWPFVKVCLTIRLKICSSFPAVAAEQTRLDLYARIALALHSLRIVRDKALSDVSVFSSLHTLALISCPAIEDVSPLASVRELDLSWCEGITDISTLGNITRLALHGCRGITDFSMLGNHEYLDLSNTNITCVSHLGSVRELNLTWCQRITDISALANIPRLTLCSCSNISDFSMLGNQEYLNLQCTNITCVSHLGSVRELNLLRCRNVTAAMMSELRRSQGVTHE